MTPAEATPQCVVRVVRASGDGKVTRTDLHLESGSWPADPLAPASIWTLDADPRLVLELHRATAVDGERASFESYEVEDPPPADGDLYSLYAWWTPWQYEAASDDRLVWRPRRYDGTDHHHCLLTWETIEPGDPAYESDDGWITPEAYERFIQNDVLRLRAQRGPA